MHLALIFCFERISIMHELYDERRSNYFTAFTCKSCSKIVCLDGFSSFSLFFYFGMSLRSQSHINKIRDNVWYDAATEICKHFKRLFLLPRCRLLYHTNTHTYTYMHTFMWVDAILLMFFYFFILLSWGFLVEKEEKWERGATSVRYTDLKMCIYTEKGKQSTRFLRRSPIMIRN